MSWIHCTALCVFLGLCVVSKVTSSPAASICKSSRINWCLISYLGPTAVPETEEYNEALFCRVRVTAGAVRTGWVTLKDADHRDTRHKQYVRMSIINIQSRTLLKHLFPYLYINLI